MQCFVTNQTGRKDRDAGDCGDGCRNVVCVAVNALKRTAIKTHTSLQFSSQTYLCTSMHLDYSLVRETRN